MTIRIVEMAGAQGCGKSTIARSLATSGFHVVSPSKQLETGNVNGWLYLGRGLGILGSAILEAARKPHMAWHLTRYWSAAGLGWERTRQMLRLACWVHRLGKLRASADKTTILEEGIVHLIADVAAPENRNPNPARLIASALPGRVDALVYVRCDAEVAFSRMRNRQPTGGRIDHWPDELALAAHWQATTLISQGVKAALGSGITVFEVDATETAPDENARLIAKWLEVS